MITKSIAETYTIRRENSSDWAIITLNEQLGSVDIQSDYGDYSHIWAARGPMSLKKFICEIDFHYAMKKWIGRKSELQFKSTIINFKRQIIQYRKDCSLKSDESRAMWDSIKDLEYCATADELYRQLEETELAEIWPDFYEYFVYDYPVQAYLFWVYLWLPFIDHIKQEIAKAA